MNKWLSMGVTDPSIQQTIAPIHKKRTCNAEDLANKRREAQLEFLLKLSLYKEPFFSSEDIAAYTGLKPPTVRRRIWEINRDAGQPIVELSHAITPGFRTGTIRYHKLVKDWRKVFNESTTKQGKSNPPC
jgi:hypothetical protein